jgi:chromosome segregation ATPase
MADHFNAIDYAHQLESAGVPAAQAEVHASALAQVVDSCLSAATDTRSMKGELLFKISTLEVTLRAEIKEVETNLRAEIKNVETRLRSEIKDVETKLRSEIKEVESNLERRIDKLEAKMNERFRWQWWANGVMVAMLLGLYFR